MWLSLLSLLLLLSRYLPVKLFIRNATSPYMVTIYIYPLRSENSSCVNSLYNLTEPSDCLRLHSQKYWYIIVLHYLTCLCIGADTHHCFDSLYCCIVWLIAIVLLKCIGTLVHSLYYLLCTALYYWNVPLGLHANITVLFAMYYCIVLLLKIMSNAREERFKGTSTHPRLWVRNARTCVLCIVLLGVWNTHHIVLLNWCTIVLHCHIHTVLSNVLLSNVFSKDQLAQKSCQAYNKGVFWCYPTWFKLPLYCIA